jgi:hypothetical protein
MSVLVALPVFAHDRERRACTHVRRPTYQSYSAASIDGLRHVSELGFDSLVGRKWREKLLTFDKRCLGVALFKTCDHSDILSYLAPCQRETSDFWQQEYSIFGKRVSVIALDVVEFVRFEVPQQVRSSTL